VRSDRHLVDHLGRQAGHGQQTVLDGMQRFAGAVFSDLAEPNMTGIGLSVAQVDGMSLIRPGTPPDSVADLLMVSRAICRRWCGRLADDLLADPTLRAASACHR